jgi:hypothetical protein
VTSGWDGSRDLLGGSRDFLDGSATSGTRDKHASAVTSVTNVTAGPAVIMSLLSS